MSASANPVPVGRALTYTITVTNHGPVDATWVKVDHFLSEEVVFGKTKTVAPRRMDYGCAPHRDEERVTCDTVRRASGATWAISLKVKPTTVGTLGNRVVVSGGEPDTNQSNDRVTIESRITPTR